MRYAGLPKINVLHDGVHVSVVDAVKVDDGVAGEVVVVDHPMEQSAAAAEHNLVSFKRSLISTN